MIAWISSILKQVLFFLVRDEFALSKTRITLYVGWVITQQLSSSNIKIMLGYNPTYIKHNSGLRPGL